MSQIHIRSMVCQDSSIIDLLKVKEKARQCSLPFLCTNKKFVRDKIDDESLSFVPPSQMYICDGLNKFKVSYLEKRIRT